MTVKDHDGTVAAPAATAWKPESMPPVERLAHGEAKEDWVTVCTRIRYRCQRNNYTPAKAGRTWFLDMNKNWIVSPTVAFTLGTTKR